MLLQVRDEDVFSSNLKSFVCQHCVETMEGIAEPRKEILIFDQIELEKGFVIWGTD